MIMRVATIKDVQEILAHRDIKMTVRYAHLGRAHKKKAVNLLDGLTAPEFSCHKMSQNEDSNESDIPQHVEISGGADRDRTDDLMTASRKL